MACPFGLPLHRCLAGEGLTLTCAAARLVGEVTPVQLLLPWAPVTSIRHGTAPPPSCRSRPVGGSAPGTSWQEDQLTCFCTSAASRHRASGRHPGERRGSSESPLGTCRSRQQLGRHLPGRHRAVTAWAAITITIGAGSYRSASDCCRPADLRRSSPPGSRLNASVVHTAPVFYRSAGCRRASSAKSQRW